MSQNLKDKAVSGVFWSGIERFSVQGVQFVVQIIMARLLLPSDYGMISMLAVFLQLTQLFMDSGFSDALIQKKDRTPLDLSTVYYFNIAISILFYLIVYVAAPYIAQFYHMAELAKITRLIFLNLILISFSAIHKTILMIRIDFKTQSKISLMSVCISGLAGILMAYQGYGVWALVVQSLMQAALTTIFSIILVKWIPLVQFSKASFNHLFSFGSKLLLSRIIHTVYYNFYTLVIGRKFSVTELGYFTRADQFAAFLSVNINVIISRVTYPILSSIQDDNGRLRMAYRQYIRLSSFVIFPLMIGLIAVAKPLITILLTDKWLGCVILLQILCLDWMLDHLSQINLNLLLVKGRSDWSLRLEIAKKAIATMILFGSIPLGVTGMCWGKVLYSVIATFMNTHYTERLIHLNFVQQMKDILPSLMLAGGMGVVVHYAIAFVSSDFLKIGIGVIVGVIFYVGTSFLLKLTEMEILLTLLKLRKK